MTIINNNNKTLKSFFFLFSFYITCDPSIDRTPISFTEYSICIPPPAFLKENIKLQWLEVENVALGSFIHTRTLKHSSPPFGLNAYSAVWQRFISPGSIMIISRRDQTAFYDKTQLLIRISPLWKNQSFHSAPAQALKSKSQHYLGRNNFYFSLSFLFYPSSFSSFK